jgi:hypothetical protein
VDESNLSAYKRNDGRGSCVKIKPVNRPDKIFQLEYPMVYEIRTYWAAAGKLEQLHNRFRNITLDVFKHHRMQVVGFWTPSPATLETGDLVYILGFASEEAKSAAWDAFRCDPLWIEGHAASEKDGKLVEKLTSVLLKPTDFSPLQ